MQWISRWLKPGETADEEPLVVLTGMRHRSET